VDAAGQGLGREMNDGSQGKNHEGNEQPPEKSLYSMSHR
jgi:hypothetical protein